jgi:DNA ligase (NAD+)
MNFRKMDLEARKRLFRKAVRAYYNEDTSILTDPEFDKLEDLIREQDPDWEDLHKTGVKVEKLEVRLAHPMPSLDKHYPDALAKFYMRPIFAGVRRWIIMDKLDGTSLQLVYFRGEPVQLVTRGNGLLGRDVSHMIPVLLKYERIPKKIAAKEQRVFRIEGVVKKSVFAAKYARAVAGKKGFDNARQMANGLFMRKNMHRGLPDVDMVVLGLYGEKLLEGLKQAAEWGFKTVRYSTSQVGPDADSMIKLLAQRREGSDYEMDGLVEGPAAFTLLYSTNDRPKELTAFKLNELDKAAEVEVLDIEYKKTRLGRWSSVVVIPPTEMDGVVVERCTAHNGAWMQENGIGPGAIIQVLRSGGVIPKIVGVVKRAKFKQPPGPWEMRGRFIYAKEKADKATRVRRIHFFMTTLGIELLAEKTLDKLYEVGFKSIDDYIQCVQPGHHMDELVTGRGLKMATSGDRTFIETQRKMQKAGLGSVQVQNIMNELHRVLRKPVSLKKLMVASGRFDAGMGERKLQQLEAAGIAMRVLCNMRTPQIVERVSTIKGWSTKTIKLLTDGIADFRGWYKPMKGLLQIDGELPKPAAQTGKLAGMRFAWTGYRDASQEQTILSNGGIIVSFGGTTTVLFYSADGKQSSKVEKAGDRAMMWEKFCKEYGL